MNQQKQDNTLFYVALICCTIALMGLVGVIVHKSYTSTNSGEVRALSASQTEQTSHRYLDVKYRSTQVDVGTLDFEYLDTSGSSFVEGAWYDSSNEYMII